MLGWTFGQSRSRNYSLTSDSAGLCNFNPGVQLCLFTCSCACEHRRRHTRTLRHRARWQGTIGSASPSVKQLWHFPELHLVQWHHSRALCSPAFNPSGGQEVGQDFLATLVSTMWLSRLKAGSSLFRSGVRGQTSWLHHLRQNPKTHTRKTFSGLRGNGVPVHTAHNHTYFPSTLLKQQCYPHTTNATAMCSENNEDAKGPVAIRALAMATTVFVHAAHQNIDPRFLPHSSCQSERGRDGETSEKRGEYEISPLVHVRCAWLFWWKALRFHRFYRFLLQCRHLLAIL